MYKGCWESQQKSVWSIFQVESIMKVLSYTFEMLGKWDILYTATGLGQGSQVKHMADFREGKK